MRIKRLADGLNAYYWEVPTKDRKAGCTLINEALGRDPASAIARAQELNVHLAGWRQRDLEQPAGPTPGTVAWPFAQFEADVTFSSLRPATQRSYRQGLRLIERHALKTVRFGDVPANAVGPAHAENLYRALLHVEEAVPTCNETRLRRRQATANSAMRAARRAWNVGMRLGWVKPKGPRPFEKMGLKAAESREALVWRREQVEPFVAQADAMGNPSMGTAAMLAYHLCQRQKDVIGPGEGDHAAAGLLWSGYRSASGRKRGEIRLLQNKTNTLIWVPLADEKAPLFPELIARLEAAPRHGPLMVMRDSVDRRTKQNLPFKADRFRHLFREIANEASLPKGLFFKNLRHSGLTELGLAGATDRELMSISGHASPQMLTRYVRRNSELAANAVRKLRVLRALDLQDAVDDDEDAA